MTRSLSLLISLTLISLNLSSCQPHNSLLSTTPHSEAQLNITSGTASFEDLASEYAAFNTLALTQNYLNRKLNHWEQEHNGEGMKRELLYGKLKHPALISQALNTATLCTNALTFPEVIQERSVNPDLDSFLEGLHCDQPDYIGEFQVNTYTPLHQGSPDIAMADDGSFVVVWHSFEQDGDDAGIYGQRFQADGSPTGPEFRVNTYTTNYQGGPSVAIAGNGDFVVVWHSTGQDGSESGIYGQRFQADGSPTGPEFRVNTYTPNSQSAPDISMADNGDFVVVWQSLEQDGDSAGVYGQRFQANGNPTGSEFRVNTHTTGFQGFPSVSMADDGDFVVVWRSSSGSEAGESGIYAQWYLNNGTPDNEEFLITHERSQYTFVASHAALNNQKHLIVTYAAAAPLETGMSYDIYATRLHKDNAFPAHTFRVNDHIRDLQNMPHIALSEEGDFTVTWASRNQDNPEDSGPFPISGGVYAKRYFNNAGTLEAEDTFRVNTTLQNGQFQPVLASNGSSLVFAWQSNEQDGDGFGIFAQRMTSGLSDTSLLWN